MQMLSVAYQLTSESDIRRLGLKLGVDGPGIDAILYNRKGDIREAAYEVLNEWRKGVPDAVTAFINLWDALTDPSVNFQAAAHNALKSSPPVLGKKE